VSVHASSSSSAATSAQATSSQAASSSVTPPSAASSSTGSSYYLSSSSNMMAASSSTGMPMAGSSSSASMTGSTTGAPITPVVVDPYPSGSYSILFAVDFTVAITDIHATAVLIQETIAINLANGTNVNNATIAQYIVITSVNGTGLAATSRRLLQTASSVPITWVLLGNITSALGASFAPNALVAAFVTKAEAGTLYTNIPGAYIPQQQLIAPVAVGQMSSSSTGLGNNNNGASAVSGTAALLVAGVAAMALLL